MSTLAALAACCVLGGAAIKPANAEPYCVTVQDTRVCGEERGSFSRVGFENTAGDWGYADVTCTSEDWILHSGGRGTSQALLEELAENFCIGHGTHF